MNDEHEKISVTAPEAKKAKKSAKKSSTKKSEKKAAKKSEKKSTKKAAKASVKTVAPPTESVAVQTAPAPAALSTQVLNAPAQAVVNLNGTLNGKFSGEPGTMLKYIIGSLGSSIKETVFRESNGRPVSLDRKISAGELSITTAAKSSAG